MQNEGTRQKARDKEEVEALAEGTGKLVNHDWTKASTRETSERADDLRR